MSESICQLPVRGCKYVVHAQGYCACLYSMPAYIMLLFVFVYVHVRLLVYALQYVSVCSSVCRRIIAITHYQVNLPCK